MKIVNALAFATTLLSALQLFADDPVAKAVVEDGGATLRFILRRERNRMAFGRRRGDLRFRHGQARAVVFEARELHENRV